MKERTTLTMYIITKWTLEYQNQESPEEGIQMKIILKRRIINELLTSYLPSVLLILLSYSTTFFRPFYFEASVTVNLTTMLVMTTIFIAVMDKLPSTAYIKMIDVWLIFGQLIPFARVVITTVMEQLRNGSERLVNHHGIAMELDERNSPITVIGISGRTKDILSTTRELEVGNNSPVNIIGNVNGIVAGTDEKLPTRHQLALDCCFWSSHFLKFRAFLPKYLVFLFVN